MTVSSQAYQATYFRVLSDNKEKEIELQYEIPFQEGVYLNLVCPCFCKALKLNKGLIVITNNEKKQKFFSERMSSYRYNFSFDELSLDTIMKSIRDKAKNQVKYELELFGTESERLQEEEHQKIADKKSLEISNGEILTQRQVAHLVAVMASCYRSRPCKRRY